MPSCLRRATNPVQLEDLGAELALEGGALLLSEKMSLIEYLVNLFSSAEAGLSCEKASFAFFLMTEH